MYKFKLIGLSVIIILLTGCITTNLSDVYSDRMESLGDSIDQELLRNILRARDGLPVRFVAITNVLEPRKMTVNSGELKKSIGENAGITSFNPSIAYEFGPSFTLQPLSSKEFYSGIVSPLRIEHYNHFLLQEFDPEIIFALFVSRIEIEITSQDETFTICMDYSERTGTGQLNSCISLDYMISALEPRCSDVSSKACDPIIRVRDLLVEKSEKPQVAFECVNKSWLSVIGFDSIHQLLESLSDGHSIHQNQGENPCVDILGPNNSRLALSHSKLMDVITEQEDLRCSANKPHTSQHELFEGILNRAGDAAMVNSVKLTLRSPEAAIHRLGIASKADSKNDILKISWAEGIKCNDTSNGLRTEHNQQVSCITSPGRVNLESLRILDLAIRLQQSSSDIIPSSQIQLIQ